MAAAPVLLMHESSLEHETGAHPERPERIVAITTELGAHDWAGYELVGSAPASDAALTAVHSEAHVGRMRALAAAGGGAIDGDTLMSAGSFVAAQHAAGGAIELVDRVLGGTAPTGFSVHRPPGHHAGVERAMGFCLFNNVAVATRWALDHHGLERVMIVDFDVHHGNGTNDIFRSDPRVLFVSVHESPLYPGTGPATDVGSGAGEGFNVNLPVQSGSGDETFVGMVEAIAVPLALTFAPQLLLVSAGFDAHRDDPLATCSVTENGFAAMSGLLRDAGAALGVPVAGLLEGGYGLDGLALSLRVSMEALAAPAGSAVAVELGRAGAGSGGAWTPTVRGARARVAQLWPALADG
jgi:acetoin utilization deacetylase AcuC-like enzyme